MPPIGYPGNAITKSARAKAGGGFESAIESSAVAGGGSALEFSANQIAQGQPIAITTDGTYSFGSRSNASPNIYMEGDRAWSRSGEVAISESSLTQGQALAGTSETGANLSVWTNASGGAAERSFTGGSNFAYMFQGEGLTLGRLETQFENYFENFQSGTKTTNKGFLSWKVWSSANPSRVFATDFDGATLTGTFSAGANNYSLGEAIVIDNGAQTFNATVIHVETGINRIHYESDVFISTDEISAATITGQTSGAQCTVYEKNVDAEFYHANAGASKLARFVNRIGESNSPPASPDAFVGLTPVSTGQHIFTVSQPNIPVGPSKDYRPNSTDTLPLPRQWNRYAMHIDGDQANPKFATQRDGTIARFDTQNSVLDALPIDPTAISRGFVINTIAIDTVTPAENFIRRYVRDFVKDDELAHVVFGNGSTLPTCTITEYQRSSAWSPTALTVRQNYGDIPSGNSVYAYIFNDTGQCINENNGLSVGAAP